MAGGMTHVLGPVHPLWAGRLVSPCREIAALAAVPAAHLAYQAYLHTAEWLLVDACAWFIIRVAIAAQVSRGPPIGVGATGSRLLNETRPAGDRRGHVVRWRTGVQALNRPSAGLVRAGQGMERVTLVIGQTIRARIAAPGGQSSALSTFVAGAVIAAFSWGMGH